MHWPPPSEQIPLLPLEVLGLSLLRLMDRMSARPVHRFGLIGRNGTVPSLGGDYGRPDVLDAINEAWDWLFSNGLTVNAGPPWEIPQGQTLEGHRVISRKGRELLKLEDPMGSIRAERLLATPLHPRIEAKARIQFAIGAYGSAVHEAFKELEIRVRTAGSHPATMWGDSLMRQAFNPDTGSLTDSSLIAGERRAIADLYAGAMGTFKNPLSHRTVDYDDPIIAAEQLLFADLLHRMLDGFEAAKNSAP